uniref:SCAN box domain-containing protein n=1 Tax=Leptobrachium leishanense TaxID=445787 RepID=A0A8C5QWM7_9ANUR
MATTLPQVVAAVGCVSCRFSCHKNLKGTGPIENGGRCEGPGAGHGGAARNKQASCSPTRNKPRTATREAWPPEQWAGIIAPFLLGEAQKAYLDLEEEAAADYPQLKAEIMARMGVTTTVRAQRFYKWRFNERQAPRSQMFDLIHLARKWLRPESQSPAQMVESLVLDRYLRELPSGLRDRHIYRSTTQWGCFVFTEVL